MKILWLTWKDRKNPLAGGAELVNESLAKRLVEDGNELILLVAGFQGALNEEIIDGYKVIRLGNKWTVYWRAYKYYKKNLVGWPDLVIDEVNTIPFFAKFYVCSPSPLQGEGRGEVKNILFIHQLCREIWFYQMFFPLSLLGYLLEPVYLWLLSDRKVITVSASTKKDLLKYGFKDENIKIISEGIEIEPVKELESYEVIKYKDPTILSLGAIKAMKRTDHIIKAFEIAKAVMPDLRLIIAGSSEGTYGAKVLKMMKVSAFADSMEYLGKVSKEKKIELLQKSHLIAVTSVKEGWGLVVTEANSQGTPAIVYNVDGLRDAVMNNETGLICKENTPEDLAVNIVNLLSDEEKYKSLRINAWEWSKEINFKNSYEEFIKFIKL
ncbi:MAG: glycosyltransferase family 4 protein [Candidatus Magasanikbacteria bacterium]|nr:glycosyltransferase family 4 protein [Candidatus Magasanikbacteria bacterium]